MFERLQKKWKVSGLQLLLILCTFAIGGSLCGYCTRLLIEPFHIENKLLYGTLYFVFLTLLWPLCVLMVSIPFGQLSFFRDYLRKIASRLALNKPENQNPESDHISVAIFASGSGSNALRIMEHFKDHPQIKIALLVSNKPGAGALHHAANFGISTLILEKETFFKGDGYVPELESADIRFIILAGFLWKIPGTLIKAYPQRIINIHPALLPNYGGKGMYGMYVHKAVLEAEEEESGITIHFVDDQYDHGATIFQAFCEVEPNDTPETLAAKVHALEHAHFSKVAEQVILEAFEEAED